MREVDAERAFSALAHELRLDVLRVLADAAESGAPERSFSEIYDAVDVDSTSRLSYHLDALDRQRQVVDRVHVVPVPLGQAVRVDGGHGRPPVRGWVASRAWGVALASIPCLWAGGPEISCLLSYILTAGLLKLP
jgi:DNA-binding transcriptional ArsR family regulator